jgi:RluA family pseudouridine synthase
MNAIPHPLVATSDVADRLDRFLARQFPEVSRARFQRLITEGHVKVEGQTAADANLKLKPDQVVEVAMPPPAAAEPLPENIDLDIVFEDKHLIVINKPVGLVVHPAAGHAGGTLVNALLAHCGESLSGIGGVKRPGIVHRLDKDTSGLLVIAKNDAAHQSLSEQFQAHGRDGRLQRSYLAFVWGVPERPAGMIATGYARQPAENGRQQQCCGQTGDHPFRATGDVRDGCKHGALQPGNWADPPDPCAHDAYRPSTVGGRNLWRRIQVVTRQAVRGGGTCS